MEDTSFIAIKDFLQKTPPIKLLEEFCPLRVAKKIVDKVVEYMSAIINEEDTLPLLTEEDLDAVMSLEYQIQSILLRNPISSLKKAEYNYLSFVHILLYNFHEAGKEKFNILKETSLINSMGVLIKKNLSAKDVLSTVPL